MQKDNSFTCLNRTIIDKPENALVTTKVNIKQGHGKSIPLAGLDTR